MNEDFTDLLAALLRADARFLVVGAYALAIHGTPRATGDLDIWIDRTAANAAPFVGRATLIANKRAAGRLKDLADLDALRAPEQG